MMLKQAAAREHLRESWKALRGAYSEAHYIDDAILGDAVQELADAEAALEAGSGTSNEDLRSAVDDAERSLEGAYELANIQDYEVRNAEQEWIAALIQTSVVPLETPARRICEHLRSRLMRAH